MRPLPLALLGLGAYGVFLVATFPAHYAALRLQERSAGLLDVREASGTVWHGRAAAEAGPPGARVPLERVEWRWKPSGLLAGRLAFDVSAASGTALGGAQLSRGLTAWEVRDAEARGPAALATAAFPWLATWRPEGEIAARAPRLRWSDAGIEGEATVEWRGASLALSMVKPLGHYRAEIRGGAPARVTLLTASGPLRLAGQGTWSPQAGLAFSGEARGDGPEARALEPLLELLGPRRPDGSRALEWRVR